MNTITCPHCGQQVEIDKALEGQIEARILSAERHKHESAMAKLTAESAAALALAQQAATTAANQQLASAKALLIDQASADLDFEKQKIAQAAANDKRRAESERQAADQTMLADIESARSEAAKLRDGQSDLIDKLRASNQAKNNAELEAKKTIASAEASIRAEVEKAADEKQRLKIAEKDNQLEAAKRQLADMQRKLNQGSQQMQGEILELDLETALAKNFPDDNIQPVAKGVGGADINQVVRTARGNDCGVILWEIKRTKNWVADWIPKLKADLRSAKANVPVIISEILPRDLDGDMGYVDGVWLVKPKLAIVLARLLRKSLLDVGRQKALAAHHGDKASALYDFATSHEFAQQIEGMLETYQDMRVQVSRERVVFEKQWAQREKQADKLLMGTANIVGSIQGHIGQSSMPRIKGLELDDGEAASDDQSVQASLL